MVVLSGTKDDHRGLSLPEARHARPIRSALYRRLRIFEVIEFALREGLSETFVLA